eukprot:12884849-Ditylum_brightwellii.AAC.1
MKISLVQQFLEYTNSSTTVLVLYLDIACTHEDRGDRAESIDLAFPFAMRMMTALTSLRSGGAASLENWGRVGTK